MSKKIRVLIVDDSATIRQTLTEILSADPRLEVMGTAPDPYFAAERIKDEVPDVILLDVEMPRMDGLTFLRKLMTQHPIPVVICSAHAEEGSEIANKAFECGAVAVITRPEIGVKQYLENTRKEICETVKNAGQIRAKGPRKPLAVERKLSADVILPPPTGKSHIPKTERIIAVGTSTGGTEALKAFLSGIPAQCPGIVIVQHMPEHFTTAFAKRLDSICAMRVKEASDGDPVLPGQALLAPGNRHMILRRNSTRYYVEVREGPPVSRHKPSVDVLFRSVAQYAGPNAVGVIMTGMGDDGAKGMLEMKQSGTYTLAQDEETCVVFGMPKEAIALGGVDRVLPLNQLAQEALRACGV